MIEKGCGLTEAMYRTHDSTIDGSHTVHML